MVSLWRFSRFSLRLFVCVVVFALVGVVFAPVSAEAVPSDLPAGTVWPDSWTGSGNTRTGTAGGVTVTATTSGATGVLRTNGGHAPSGGPIASYLPASTTAPIVFSTTCSTGGSSDSCGTITYTFSKPIRDAVLFVSDIGAWKEDDVTVTQSRVSPLTLVGGTMALHGDDHNEHAQVNTAVTGETALTHADIDSLIGQTGSNDSCANFACGVVDVDLVGSAVSSLTFEVGYEGTYTGVDGWAMTLGFVPAVVDFGDAPDSYGTASADGGVSAGHVVEGFDAMAGTAPLMLGALVDGETDGSPGTAADGDGGDEDAVPVSTTVNSSNPMVSVAVRNDTAVPATVVGWLDLDVDGVFEVGEQVTATVPAGAGATSVGLTFPDATVAGDSYLRLRVVPEGTVVGPTGLVTGGEVEDHRVKIVPVPELTVKKTSTYSPDSRVGDTVMYTVTATNTGLAPFTTAKPATVIDDLTGVLDDATYNNDAVSTVGAVGYTAPRWVWQNALDAGKSVEVTYSVTVTGEGDRVVENVAFAASCVPGASCAPTTPPAATCATDGKDPVTGLSCARVRSGIPVLSVQKSSDVTTVNTGDTVTYTVTATNIGTVDYTPSAPAVIIDDLSGVIDDATFDPGSLTASVSGPPTYAAPRITWVGELAVKDSVTLTYQVTYNKTSGDANLTNIVFAPTCAAGDPTCSTPPPTPTCDPADENGHDPDTGAPCARVVFQPHVSITKTSDPGDGATVTPGAEISYTLTFTNTGTATGKVAVDDVLTGVVDDAVLVSGPQVSNTSLAVTAAPPSPAVPSRFTVTGSVAAGAEVTVTYTVKVKTTDRGDDLLTNFVVKKDATPPKDCTTGNPACTHHPIRTPSTVQLPLTGGTITPWHIYTATALLLTGTLITTKNTKRKTRTGDN